MPIYLDHNATTPLRPQVLDAIVTVLRDDFGNASSVHRFGSRARCAIEDVRAAVAAVIGAEPAEIVFTSGGTESNNLALFGATRAAGLRRLLVCPTEHSSVIAAGAQLAEEDIKVEQLLVNSEGVLDLEDFERRLESGERALVSVGWANNEIGTIQPIDRIADICAQRGALLHVDAVQALGKVPLKVKGLQLVSFSAHKIGGPKGCGVLFVRRDTPLRPLLSGGGQERGRRAGSENVAAIVGMGLACTLAQAELDWFGEVMLALRDRLWCGLRDRIDHLHRHGAANALPNTLNVRFDGVRGEALVAALDLAGVAISGGSACAAGAGEPSHVLLALGLDEDAARDGVRFSLGRTTTPDEVEQVIEATAAAVERIRSAHARRAAR